MFNSSAQISIGTSNSSFFPPDDKSLPILDGKFDYNHAFAAFLASTNQKKHTAEMVGLLCNNLKQQDVLLAGENIINVADIGCADSTTCLGYLSRMNYEPGFEYTGFDINDQFLQDAQLNLRASSLIKKHKLIKEDVLTSEAAPLSSFLMNAFELIFVSHLAYYLKSEADVRIFIKNMLSLLTEQGLLIFLHENSTYYFRSTYNSHYKNINAPDLLRQGAFALLNEKRQYNETLFTSKLYFTEMSEALWEAVKNPVCYRKFAKFPGFIDNLNKLSFIVQCDLSQLMIEGTLGRFVDEIKDVLTRNHYSFDLKTSMQVLTSHENQYGQEISAALREIEHEGFFDSEVQQIIEEQSSLLSSNSFS